MRNRKAGILLPVTALPSRYGVGCFSEAAYRFIDWLRDSGQSYWQILPLGQTGYGDSPYQSFSSYAGNPYLISLEALMGDGLLTEEECARAAADTSEERVSYQALYERRYPLLRLAYARSGDRVDGSFQAFEQENREWLDDYALFMAIKESLGGIPLSEWQEPYRMREPSVLARCRETMAEEIGFWKFLQYRFFRDWRRLKEYANTRGVRIIGDIPIYVSADSADVWVSPELFQLNEQGTPLAVAGCPPDGFTPEGQLWGNPLYRWEAHRQSGYAWWICRLAHAFSMYDLVRIDHFRGFDEYYSIPYGAPNAVGGHWEPGPGMALFRAVEQAMGRQEGIAEDLGYMTDTVRRLVKDSGFAGMKILQFGFDEQDRSFTNEYLPHLYGENTVAYPGTHDNPTLAAWLSSLSDAEWGAVREYLWDFYTPREQMADSLIGLLMRSPSWLCVVPLQDYLGLDDRARINRPSTTGGNWVWRVRGEDLSPELARRIRRLTAIGGRL